MKQSSSCDNDFCINSKGKSLRFRTSNLPTHPAGHFELPSGVTAKDNILTTEENTDTIGAYTAEDIVRVYIHVGRKLISPQVKHDNHVKQHVCDQASYTIHHVNM